MFAVLHLVWRGLYKQLHKAIGREGLLTSRPVSVQVARVASATSLAVPVTGLPSPSTGTNGAANNKQFNRSV